MSVVELDNRRQPAAPEWSPEERRAAARALAEAEAAAGNPLSGLELGSRFDRSERWGRQVLADLGGSRQPAAQPPGGSRQTTDGSRNGSGPAAGNGSQARPAAAKSGSRQRKPPSAAGGRQGDAVPTSLVVVTKVAVAIVALVTMFTSYSHTMDLAYVAGQSNFVAWILPAAVDGLVIAGSTSLLVDHHLNRPGSTVAWAAVVLGLASSMAANVVSVDPSLVDVRVVKWVMAGYAPLALAVSGHLLLRMLGHRRAQ